MNTALLLHLLDSLACEVIEEDGRKTALRVTGGTGGLGLTLASNVDRSPRKALPLGLEAVRCRKSACVGCGSSGLAW